VATVRLIATCKSNGAKLPRLHLLQKPTAEAFERRIKRRLSRHLRDLGIDPTVSRVSLPPAGAKAAIRACHHAQRRAALESASAFIISNAAKLLPFFASGADISIDEVSPRLQPIQAGTLEAKLFRFASFTWSVPVSEGFGRRMRFLIWDNHNDKLIGLLALGDPVFNLNVRDRMLGWTSADRKERLVNVMDAYVLGAVPPYNQLLCGKLVSCLVRSKEVRDLFDRKYAGTRGIISHTKKHAQLLLVTTSSALGRSSIYNRLRLGGVDYFKPIGYTAGFGHFHVPTDLFELMRGYLRLRKHPYAGGNRFGNGPNWKFRAIRAALELMNVDRDILRHGIRREVFASRLATNADACLRGCAMAPDYLDLKSVAEISEAALERWIRPRAHRRPEFLHWRKEDVVKLLLAPNQL
jgi:Druantia protein DruA